jgi:hypothetical protein
MKWACLATGFAPDFARDSYGAAANTFKGIARAPAQFTGK